MVAIHAVYYNFGRIHKTLRITPAMAASLTDHVWSLEEIVLSGKLSKMASCPKCDGFTERFNIDGIREYRNIVRQLIEIVDQGTFWLMKASCSLQDVFNTPMPGDIIMHDFQCSTCGRAFHLAADTYHGNASWTVGDIPKPIENLSKPN